MKKKNEDYLPLIDLFNRLNKKNINFNIKSDGKGLNFDFDEETENTFYALILHRICVIMEDDNEMKRCLKDIIPIDDSGKRVNYLHLQKMLSLAANLFAGKALAVDLLINPQEN